MNPKMIAKQIIDFDKAAFDRTFDAITAFQLHSEKMMNAFLEKANLLPAEGKRMMREWMDAYEKGKNDFKESVDNSFNTIEQFLVSSAETADFSGYAPTEETTQSEKKATTEDVKEFIQPEPVAVEKAETQEIPSPMMVEEAEKQEAIHSKPVVEDISGNVLLKTVRARKSVKSGKNKKLN